MINIEDNRINGVNRKAYEIELFDYAEGTLRSNGNHSNEAMEDILQGITQILLHATTTQLYEMWKRTFPGIDLSGIRKGKDSLPSNEEEESWF